MKKFAAGLTVLAMAASLAACGSKTETNTADLNAVDVNETLPVDENLTAVDNAVGAVDNAAGNLANVTANAL